MARIPTWLPQIALVAASVMALTATAVAAEKPNILVIFGDDIGQSNISAYSMGVVGYKTPNIDRIAKEGMMFTDNSEDRRDHPVDKGPDPYDNLDDPSNCTKAVTDCLS